MLVNAASSGNDPLGLMNDLAKWNKEHSDEQIEKSELPVVVSLAFACHDLGNIAEEILEEDGKVKLSFLLQYQTQGAEDKSQQIAEKVIKSSDIPEEQKRRFLPLVLHLINETKFQPDGEALFGVFARVVDQIGNDLFSKNERRIYGLLEEMYAENLQAQFNTYFFFNFARKRFIQLVPDETARNIILIIWNKKLPEEKTEFVDRSIKVKDWINNEVFFSKQE